MQSESVSHTRLMRSTKNVKLSTLKNIQPKQKPNVKQRQFNCPICKVSFPTRKLYDVHNKTHRNKKVVSEQLLDNFVVQINNVRCQDGKTDESEKYQCNICQTCFINFNDLDTHVRQHFDLDSRYKCNICESSFFDIGHLVKHTSVVHSNSNFTLNCYVCGDLFTSIEEFVEHDQEHKKHSSEPMNCSECGETFISLFLLNSHKKSHTMPRTQPYVCQKCSLRFSRSEDLHNHIRVHDGKSIYCCTICDRMFAHSKNLTNHVHKCHKSCIAADEMDLIDFVVDAEVKAQLDRKKLENVLNITDSVQVDGEVFRLNVIELVSKHMKKGIPSSTPFLPLLSMEHSSLIPTNTNRKFSNFHRKYKCPLCDLIFVKAKTLEIHCKRNHFGNYTLDQIKQIQMSADRNSTQSLPRAILNCRHNVVQKHECSSCNQTYKTRQELISHIKIDHNGSTPYKCVRCSETFSTSNALSSHVLKHPDKRHKCRFCGLTFMNLYSLGKHEKRHEGNCRCKVNEM